MSLIVPDKWSKQREIYKQKKKYRAWLVGNLEHLGYRQDEETYTNEWSKAAYFIAYMIYYALPKKERDTFTSTSLEWFGDIVVYIESYPVGLIFSKAYQKLRKIVADDDLEALKQNTIWIEDFRIPKLGTNERIIFDRALKVYTAKEEENQARKMRIEQAIDNIKREL